MLEWKNGTFIARGSPFSSGRGRKVQITALRMTKVECADGGRW
jgi:hypothetical protein